MGSSGTTGSEVFNRDSFDYMNVSISWDDDYSSIVEQGCTAMLGVVTDGCDIPSEGDTDNLKHGGTISYRNPAANATLRIEPLVMKRVWDRWNGIPPKQCNDMTSNNYMDTATLDANINDFCKVMSARPGGIAESGSQFTQTYNDDRPNRVDLTINWPLGPRNYQIFREECLYYMSTLKYVISLPIDPETKRLINTCFQ